MRSNGSNRPSGTVYLSSKLCFSSGNAGEALNKSSPSACYKNRADLAINIRRAMPAIAGMPGPMPLHPGVSPEGPCETTRQLGCQHAPECCRAFAPLRGRIRCVAFSASPSCKAAVASAEMSPCFSEYEWIPLPENAFRKSKCVLTYVYWADITGFKLFRKTRSESAFLLRQADMGRIFL